VWKKTRYAYLASRYAYWAGFLGVHATFKSIGDIIPNLLDLLYLRIVIFMDTTYVDSMDTPYWELVKRAKSTETSKGTSKSQPKSIVKSAQAEETVFEAGDTQEPHNQGQDTALTDRLDWNNPKGKEYPFDLSKPLPLILVQGRQVVLVDYFINNDLKYLRGGSLSTKYTTSTTKTKVAKYDILGIEDMVLSRPSTGSQKLPEEAQYHQARDIQVIPMVAAAGSRQVKIHRARGSIHRSTYVRLMKSSKLDHEGSKRQKTNEEQSVEEEKELSEEELQKLIMIVLVEEVYVETFDDMLKVFDGDDLDKLWSLVKERSSSTDSTDDKERTLWVELKRLFEPNIDDILWKLQRYMHDPLTWSTAKRRLSTAKLINGDSVSPVTSASTGAEGPIPPKTAEQKLARKNELKAKSTLMLAILDEHLLKFHACKDVKVPYGKLSNRFRGNKESKKMQKTILKQNYENFATSSQEGLDKTYDRFQKLISQLEIHGKSSSSLNSQNVAFVSLDNSSSTNETVNTAHSISAASSKDQASTASYADDVMFSFFANQSNAPQLDYEDLEQIDADDLEEMDLKCQVAMLTMRVKRMQMVPRNQGECNRDAPRKECTVALSTYYYLLVVQDWDRLSYDWSFQAEEAPHKTLL
ncbi:hypothetical protein Tco_1252474, partial [Tanacetum coccineum]